MGTSLSKHRKNWLVGLLLTAGLSVAILFNNCSAVHESRDQSFSSFGKNCAIADAMDLFANTYHPFLKKNCVNCHVPGGIGKGAFASSGPEVAFQAFSLVGYSKISEFAVNPNHQSPYTGTKHIPEINRLKEEWSKGMAELANCDSSQAPTEFVDDQWADVRVHSRSKAINPSLSGGESVIQWNLNTDMLPPPEGVTWPNLPGAYFQLSVNVTIKGGVPAYLISKPRIVYPQPNPNATDISLESIRIKINGVQVINETTFHYVKADARKNQDTLISAGTMVALGALKTSDVISFSVGKIEPVVLPPPPPGPSVQFTTAETRLSQERGTATLRVRLNQPIDSFVTVGFAVSANSTARSRCCSTILDIDLRSVEVKNFDADYDLYPQEMTLIFEPNEVEKTIEVRVVDDQRFEGAEQVRIDLVDFFIDGGTPGNIGTQKSHTVYIPDDDPQPAADEMTFSKLMKPGGVFYNNCVACHHRNSADQLAREYDMTNYEDLTDPLRKRVVPFNPAASVMFQRMNSDNQEKPMPLDGLLPLLERKKVENWILNGAKNN